MRGKPVPVVCYKKIGDESEVAIENFHTIKEAIEWSVANNIMCEGAVKWTIRNNTYIAPINKTARPKYFDRHQYRFAKIIQYQEPK
ncbi:hypothetical protein [Bacillus pseudomycoides]|uniref:hypothetical protein n=1 Tax=Bacillus pseudomycoides TaxID=64104 RepID=UPI000BF05E43|nr:hypothetical protein [Bacillus pseudomycoides]PEJ37272.1 hypothetical protein CN677_09485 [Bacillus pseudomycoides]PHA98375.1 hypothetical protein COE78_01990 [Bacillus pseudomycoides]PHC78278.1 hypothetical protein COF38_07205 [Bacillus pseudomycoides]